MTSLGNPDIATQFPEIFPTGLLVEICARIRSFSHSFSKLENCSMPLVLGISHENVFLDYVDDYFLHL
jgi:hypothetical protein